MLNPVFATTLQYDGVSICNCTGLADVTPVSDCDHPSNQNLIPNSHRKYSEKQKPYKKVNPSYSLAITTAASLQFLHINIAPGEHLPYK